MNWTQDKSVKLTQGCIYGFMAAFVVILLGAPTFFRWLLNAQGLPAGKLLPVLLTIYAGAVPAAAALWNMNRLLRSIRENQVFIPGNVVILRRLSWACMGAALVCLLGGTVYLSFLLVGAIAAFIGLILRVVKNVFAQAVELKTENDYTI